MQLLLPRWITAPELHSMIAFMVHVFRSKLVEPSIHSSTFCSSYVRILWCFTDVPQRYNPNSFSWVCAGASSHLDLLGTSPRGGVQVLSSLDARARCPNYLSWFLSMWRSSGPTSSTPRMTEHLTLSLRGTPVIVCRKSLVCAFLFFRSLLTVHEHV